MKDSITVKISDLQALLKDMKRDGKDLVTLSILEAEDDIPALLIPTAFHSQDSSIRKDYDALEDISDYDDITGVAFTNL